MFLRKLLIAGLVAMAFANPARAADDRLTALMDAYLCPILAALESIRAQPPSKFGRFLALEAGQPDHYVQCLFHDDDTALWCEIASGHYYPPAKAYFTRKRLAQVKALGFGTDRRKGNFGRDNPLAGPDAVPGVARLMIESLYRVFDLTPDMPLLATAPMAPEIGAVQRRLEPGGCATS